MNENQRVSEYIESYIDLNAKHHADLEVVLLGYEECEPGHFFGPIMRPYHLLHFVTEGEGLLRLDGQEFHLQKGDIFFIPEDKIAFFFNRRHCQKILRSSQSNAGGTDQILYRSKIR